MRARTTAWVACVAALATCAIVYSITPRNSVAAERPRPAPSPAIGATAAFDEGEVLHAAARLGYSSMARAGATKNLVFVDVTASEDEAIRATAAPIHTSLVIDTSGSMRGPRLQSAVAAAIGWMDRMRDSDTLSVVAFDDAARIVAAPQLLVPQNRQATRAALQAMTAQASTCLSCGIQKAHQLLLTQPGLRRMIVLSDGIANRGLQTPSELRGLAQPTSRDDISIVTLGLGQNYNDEGLAALAFETNGSHHFVQNAQAIGEVFVAEANKIADTIATRAEVVLTLAKGVELMRIHDRTHSQQGNRIVIPLGAFARGQTKTVLAAVHVRSRAMDVRPVAEVSVRFEDASRAPRHIEGHLSAAMGTTTSTLDPMVAVRLAKGEGADAVEQASKLFAAGRRDEAIRLLDANEQRLAEQERHAPPPAARALASARATSTAFRERIETAPAASARSEVLRSKVAGNRAKE